MTMLMQCVSEMFRPTFFFLGPMMVWLKSGIEELWGESSDKLDLLESLPVISLDFVLFWTRSADDNCLITIIVCDSHQSCHWKRFDSQPLLTS